MMIELEDIYDIKTYPWKEHAHHIDNEDPENPIANNYLNDKKRLCKKMLYNILPRHFKPHTKLI